MVSNTDKDKIRARIQDIMGDTSYPHGIMSAEIEYIAALGGEYQELAIWQAALGQLVAKNADPIKQQAIRARINVLSQLIQQQEIAAVNDKKAWSDKYGNLQYIKKGDKIKVDYSPGKIIPIEPYKVELMSVPECKLCVDGKITAQYGDKKWYPCECALGDKWAKDTGYMGPPIDISGKTQKNNKFKEMLQTKPFNGLKTYKSEPIPDVAVKFKSTSTTMQYSDYTNMSDMAKQLTEGLAGTINALIGGTEGAARTSVTEIEEPKGRKFKEKL